MTPNRSKAVVLFFASLCLLGSHLVSAHDFGGPSSPGSAPGSQTLRDPVKSRTKGGEISLLDGSESFATVDLMVRGVFPMVLTRSYDSRSIYDSPLGYGWDHNYNVKLFTYADGSVVIRWNTGIKSRFIFTGGSYASEDNSPGKLVDNGDGSITYFTQTGMEYAFDVKGNLERIVDNNGNYLLFEYTTEKKPLSGISAFAVNPAAAQIVAYDYQLKKISEGTVGGLTGRFLEFSYDANNGRLLTVADASGYTVSYVHDAKGNLTRVTYPEDLFHAFSYLDPSDVHNITAFVRGHVGDGGDVTSTLYENTYDDEDRVIQQNRAGGTLQIQYTIPMVKTTTTQTVKDAVGTTLHTFQNVYEFNSDGFLEKYTDEEGNQEDYIRDTKNNVIRRTLWENQGTLPSPALVAFQIINYGYDADSNLVSTDVTLDDGETLAWEYTYDHGWLKSVTFSSSRYPGRSREVISEFDYNDEGYPRYVKKESRLTDDPGIAQYLNLYYVHNAYGQVTGIRYDNGDEESITYTNGLITDLDGLGYERSPDGRGNVVKVKDRNNNATDLVYDEFDRIVQVTNALGEETSMTHDGWDLTEIEVGKTDTAPGHKTHLDYDDLGRLVSWSRDLSGSPVMAVSFGYDSQDNIVSITNALNKKTMYAYDEKNRMTSVTDPDLKAFTLEYDLLGNIVKEVQPKNGETLFEYDKFSRLKKVIDALGNATAYEYELDSVIALKDRRSHEWRFGHDLMGRITSRMSPQNEVEQYLYDNKNRLSRIINPDAMQIDYTYDSRDRLTRSTVNTSPVREIVYTYDNMDNLLSYADTDIASGPVLTYTYDALNRLDTCNNLQVNKALDYDFNPQDLLERLTLREAGGATLFSYEYLYDTADRLASMTEPSAKNSSFSYDNVGRLETITYPNGVTAQMVYQDNGWLESMTYRKSGGTLFEAYQYGYDDMGNLMSVGDSAGTTSYTYDGLNRLLSATYPGTAGLTNESYTYDPVGNRLTSSASSDWTYNPNNSLTHFGTTDFVYDQNGNAKSKTVSNVTTSYGYDALNRLNSVSSPGVTASYLYDHASRRIKKDVNGSEKWFMYVGFVPIAEFDAAGSLTRHYSYLPETMTLHAVTDDGHYYSTLSDHLNVPRKALDSTGKLVWSGDYQAFGQMTFDDDPDEDDNRLTLNLRFPGQYFDSETGLHGNSFRHYDSEAGRFLSMDPAPGHAYLPETLNPYPYAFNNPLTFIDPDGREGAMGRFGKDLVRLGAGKLEGATLAEKISRARTRVNRLIDYLVYWGAPEEELRSRLGMDRDRYQTEEGELRALLLGTKRLRRWRVHFDRVGMGPKKGFIQVSVELLRGIGLLKSPESSKKGRRFLVGGNLDGYVPGLVTGNPYALVPRNPKPPPSGPGFARTNRGLFNWFISLMPMKHRRINVYRTPVVAGVRG